MSENSDLRAFYIVEKDDKVGETARGPFTMSDAEMQVGETQKIVTRSYLLSLQNGFSSKHDTDTEKAIEDYFDIKYWYYGLFPAFVFSAVFEVFIGVTGPLVGIIVGFVVIRNAKKFSQILRWSVTIGGSLVIGFVISFLRVPGSPAANPYFLRDQLVAQAIIAGIGGIIFYIIFIAFLRWWQRKKW